MAVIWILAVPLGLDEANELEKSQDRYWKNGNQSPTAK